MENLHPELTSEEDSGNAAKDVIFKGPNAEQSAAEKSAKVAVIKEDGAS